MRIPLSLVVLFFSAAALILLFFPTSPAQGANSAMQRPGGTTPNVREPTPELRALCETLRPEAEERIKALGGDVETFEPEGYKSQVVAGVNYFVKVLVAPQHPSFSHALLRIYKPIPPKEPKLSGVKLVAGDSELSYFGPGDSVAENAGAEERNAHMAGAVSHQLLLPTPHVGKIVNELRKDIEARANGGEEYSLWEIVGYKNQVVAGINYFVKIMVSENSAIHARIFEPLPHTGQAPEVAAVQTGKGLDDDVAYF